MALAVVAFAAGVSRRRLPRAPVVAVSGVVIGYSALLVITGVYSASCSACVSHISYDSRRWVDFFAALVWGGLFASAILVSLALGVGTGAALARLRNQ